MSSINCIVPIHLGGWLSCAVLALLPSVAIGQTWPRDIQFALTNESANAAGPTSDTAADAAALDEENATSDCCEGGNYYYYQPNMCDELKCRMTSCLQQM